MNSWALALIVGLGFGAALEQAGLGQARKLVGQFYLRDFTVLKVMLSAILTAMLGTFWLGRIGLIDLAAVFTPPTFLAPQVVGGLIFGAGFVISGLCPGTSCVAAASGRLDGLAVMAGLLVGVLGAGLAFPAYAAFYGATPKGVFTLPDLTHLPYGVVVGLIAVGGLALFAGIERFERRS